jgi:MYXO-CTERM domain-containing protein
MRFTVNALGGALLVVSAALLATPAPADAFCGFYVGGADAKLYNNATMVVLMREGTRTVLSMQNNYQGPPENFAMVVPVPVVLQKENVKTLPREVFDRVDTLAAPRLVEYWEKDPCEPEIDYRQMAMAPSAAPGAAMEGGGRSHGVKIEAQFTVAEYDIVVLSAKDSTGLDTWLHENKYKIPDGAEPLLRPYVADGSKFFVAKVDPKKVTFKDGQAMLSPLRFHYDTDEFKLPVRLGLINSSGTQDLIVHIIARNQRYEVANYPNVTIPTNINVGEDIRGVGFARFYAALFDATLEKNPKAVVTEYSWSANNCDPCPSAPLSGNELVTLGADVLPNMRPDEIQYGYGFVLTRLHARYGKESLGEDLVFKAAPPIVGGREFVQNEGKLEQGARPDSNNNFQGRYAIRHEWKGAISCDKPIRGRWGGPWASVKDAQTQPSAAKDLAFAPRGGVQLGTLVRQDVPEIGLKMGALGVTGPASVPVEPKKAGATDAPKGKACGCRVGGAGEGVPRGALVAFAIGALLLVRSRRRRPRHA